MNINFAPFAILWVLLAAGILGLIAYRWLVSEDEGEALHLSDPREVTRQATLSHRLDVIDRWGKTLTVVTTVYSVLLAAAYTYHIWITWNAQVF
jgi:hypothetical protein